MKKLADVHQQVVETVTEGYKKIETGVVEGYKKIETGAVEGFQKVSDKAIDLLFAKKGETVEEARNRLKGTTSEDRD